MPHPGPTIASGAIRKLLAVLGEHGHAPGPFLAEVGLDPAVAADQDARVPLEKLHALWEVLDRVLPRAQNPAFAKRYAPGDYGLVGFVAMNTATLGEGLAHVVRYLGLWTDDPAVELHADGTLAVVYQARFADRLGLHLATEAAPAEILHGARQLTQTWITPRRVCFPHAAPADLRPYEAFFGCPVRFGASTCAMALRPEDLALPLPRADAQLGAFLRKMANEALEKRGGGPLSPPEAIRRIIAEELPRGLPTLDLVARRMGTSERTLRRRLDDDGTSFRALLDETRAELARSFVRDRRLPLSEVAFLLGFSEPSAFHRAFRRWTDTTPSAYRAGQAGAASDGEE